MNRSSGRPRPPARPPPPLPVKIPGLNPKNRGKNGHNSRLIVHIQRITIFKQAVSSPLFGPRATVLHPSKPPLVAPVRAPFAYPLPLWKCIPRASLALHPFF